MRYVVYRTAPMEMLAIRGGRTGGVCERRCCNLTTCSCGGVYLGLG